MPQTTKDILKNYIDASESPFFGEKTITGLLRSILEPIVENNSKALIITRLIKKDGIEGLIRRIEYSRNVDMYDYFEASRKNNLIELEFVLITSQRYSALLMWDYSDTENKDSSKIFCLLNSCQINQVFEIINKNLKDDLSGAFYEYKPERRENTLMNQAVFSALKLLNENIIENDFKDAQNATSVSESEFEAYSNSITKHTREVSHEIRNQLSILDIYSKLLEKELGADNKNLAVLKKALGIISFQLEELKEFQEVILEEKSLVEVVLKAIEMVSPLVQKRKNNIVFKGEDLKTNIDENKYISALINVLKNASESSQNDTIEVELREENGFAGVVITNHGEKIEEPEKIFKTGFSTKGTAGVGLSVSRRYLEAQFGRLELLHSDDKSTSFVVKTPLRPETLLPPASSAVIGELASGSSLVDNQTQELRSDYLQGL